MMFCYILFHTQPYKDVLVTSYICNICNIKTQVMAVNVHGSQSFDLLQHCFIYN